MPILNIAAPCCLFFCWHLLSWRVEAQTIHVHVTMLSLTAQAALHANGYRAIHPMAELNTQSTFQALQC